MATAYRIGIEGVDTTGKSTLAKNLANELIELGYTVELVKELPDEGNNLTLGGKIRNLINSEGGNTVTDILPELFYMHRINMACGEYVHHDFSIYDRTVISTSVYAKSSIDPYIKKLHDMIVLDMNMVVHCKSSEYDDLKGDDIYDTTASTVKERCNKYEEEISKYVKETENCETLTYIDFSDKDKDKIRNQAILRFEEEKVIVDEMYSSLQKAVDNNISE